MLMLLLLIPPLVERDRGGWSQIGLVFAMFGDFNVKWERVPKAVSSASVDRWTTHPSIPIRMRSWQDKHGRGIFAKFA